MSTLLELFGFVLLVIVTITGLVGNGLIAIINGIDWFQSRKLSPADMILSGLSLFRFAFLAVVMQYAISHFFFTVLNSHTANNILWILVKTADLWFAAWLSVLYCVKIANFSHPLFLQMKRRFPGLVPWLLLGTVVYSAVITSIIMIGNTIFCKFNSFEPLLSNSTDLGIKTPDFCKYYILLYVLPDFFPFVIFSFSSSLLLTSLWRHKKLLQNNAKDVSTEVHLNAIKALASFSVLYVSSFCVEILDLVLSWMKILDDLVIIFIFNVMAVYSSGHAIILIFVNPKLKRESARILRQLKSCMKTPS